MKTLTDYFINPIYNIIHFIMKDDFLIDGNRNYPFFIINLISSLIISFFGCVCDEFVILFFGGLENETYEIISERANDLDSEDESVDNNEDN